MGVYLDMSSYEEIKEKQIKYTEKMLKYLCYTIKIKAFNQWIMQKV